MTAPRSGMLVRIAATIMTTTRRRVPLAHVAPLRLRSRLRVPTGRGCSVRPGHDRAYAYEGACACTQCRRSARLTGCRYRVVLSDCSPPLAGTPRSSVSQQLAGGCARSRGYVANPVLSAHPPAASLGRVRDCEVEAVRYTNGRDAVQLADPSTRTKTLRLVHSTIDTRVPAT